MISLSSNSVYMLCSPVVLARGTRQLPVTENKCANTHIQCVCDSVYVCDCVYVCDVTHFYCLAEHDILRIPSSSPSDQSNREILQVQNFPFLQNQKSIKEHCISKWGKQFCPRVFSFHSQQQVATCTWLTKHHVMAGTLNCTQYEQQNKLQVQTGVFQPLAENQLAGSTVFTTGH